IANRIASRRSFASAHPIPEILRQLGEAIPPILQRLAPSLVPKVGAFSELLSHMERAPHRKGILPRFSVDRKPDGLIGLTYLGDSRLCRFAEGLLVGMAVLIGEPIGLRHPTCVTRGDESCTFVARLLRSETRARAVAEAPDPPDLANRLARPGAGRTRSG